MAAEKLNIANHLDTSEQTMAFLVDYVKGYLSRTPLYDVEDICESFPTRNVVLYVDFDIYLDKISIKDVTIQDHLHHIDMTRDSLVLSWLLTDEVIPAINKANKESYQQERDIYEDNLYELGIH